MAAALGFVLGLGACTSDVVSHARRVPATTTTAAPTTTTTALDAAGDHAQAAKAVLGAGDLPSGWTATRHARVPGDDSSLRDIAACLGLPDPTEERSAAVDGPDLSDGPTRQVSSNVVFTKTEDDAAAAFSAFQGPKFASCLKDQLAALLTAELKSADVREVTAEPLSVTAADTTIVAVRLTATAAASAAGRSTTLVSDLVTFRRRRELVTATFFQVGDPFPTTLEQAMVAKLAARA